MRKKIKIKSNWNRYMGNWEAEVSEYIIQEAYMSVMHYGAPMEGIVSSQAV